jgi:hypothetical protein
VISFRYHIVSIVAVFLAFALGIVVGTAALNGAVTDDLRNQVKNLVKDRSSLQDDKTALQKQAGNANDFATTYGAAILDGTLNGQTVAIIQTPGASDDTVNAVQKDLAAAGAKVNSWVQITADYSDPARGSDIKALATGPAHPVGLTLPATDDASRIGAALIAYVLVGTPTVNDIDKVMAGLAGIGVAKVHGSDVKVATLAVIVTGGASTKDSASNKSLLQLVNAISGKAKGSVVAGDGDSADDNGLVATVRNDAVQQKATSTVDDVDTALGQFTTAVTLDSATSGKIGHYGNATGATAVFPPK